MRDAKMREQAHAIQGAVGGLLQDVKRLGERIGKLRDHFETTTKDIGQIETSMRGSTRSISERVENASRPCRAGGPPPEQEKIETAKERGAP